MPVTPKMNFSAETLASMRKAARAARVSRWETAKGEPERYKSLREQVACMALLRAFQKNDWELSADQITEVHKSVYGSEGQSATKLFVIARNKMEPMPIAEFPKIGDLIPHLLADAEYDDWLIVSTGEKSAKRYICIQYPDYDKYYGENWEVPVIVTKSAAKKAAKAAKAAEAAATAPTTEAPTPTAEDMVKALSNATDEEIPEGFFVEAPTEAPVAETEVPTETIEVTQEQEQPVIEEAPVLSKKAAKKAAKKAKAA